MRFKTLNERFMNLVDRNGPTIIDSPCWLWKGAKRGGGYGTMCFYEDVDGEKKKLHRYAHRVSWELHWGAIPDGRHLCHRCDNPPCVNPAHLFLGTHQENMADRDAKGRHSNGGARPMENREEIASRLKAGESTHKLAKEYGVHRTTLGKMRRKLETA